MNWKTWAPLMVAVVLGLVAALVASNLISKNHKTGEVASKSERIVVAKQDVPPGHTLTVEDMAYGQLPASVKASGTFADMSQLVGRVAATQLGKDQAIVAPLLAPAGEAGGLAALVPDGMRAITLEVNEFSGVAGLLVPGCRVDVLSTLHKDGEHDTITRIIAQNLKVSAVGQRTGKSDDSTTMAGTSADAQIARSVTLFASPKDAETIQLACDSGRPWLVLRGAGDTARADSSGVTLGELRGKSAKSALAAANAPKTAQIPAKIESVTTPTTRPAVMQASSVPTTEQRIVQVIRGVAESTVTFEVPAMPTALSATDTSPAVGGH